ncbi:G protein-coupled glucose receptor regulating Gpa2-domain-containing protein [Colletotrichum navitas]|uniref:G protein-coupled glucose receptor regulating Gpa2-domain-containing protein n=1 Tax=Colletotrichum navitas TaxID=681940 RepID=A0AAD8Q147_9PEZI|nr:G protein-coupled glucose receptor regulating Gpa2-domain-containing protein [Colletotrichum navitas]KAK1593851.1 G protein-coupled glucose receptor regulating Gpa2-domain-containing protein [Colletotrichum navitas]
MVFDAGVAAVTLTGSLLSFLATSGVLISFIFYHDQQRSFRHALVLNLTLAEFINSLDNSISGIIYIKNKELRPGPACIMNGMIGQLSVQASDFSILAIAVVTFLTITRKTYMPDSSTFRKVIICLSIWIVPITTSVTATVMDTIKPVSGNWCWITQDRTDLRYGLAHGWRFGIIFTTIIIYMYVWWFLGRHFRSMVSTSEGIYDSGNSTSNAVTSTIRKKQGFKVIQGPDLEMDEFERLKPLVNEPPLTPRTPTIPHSPAQAFRKLSVVSNEDDKAGRHTRPSVSAGTMHFLDDKPEEEPKRKMSSRISRFDNNDLDMTQASEARFSYLEQEDKLYRSAAGGPSHLHQDMPPPVATRFSRYGKSSFSFGPSNKLNTSRDSTVSWHLPAPQDLRSRDFPLSPGLQDGQSKPAYPNVTVTMMSDFPARRGTRRVEREIKRMMFLNAYPIMYVVLWIPGLVNRLLEASGNSSQSRVLQALQSSSQYIGFANAITYGFNQHVRHRIKGDLFRWIRGK